MTYLSHDGIREDVLNFWILHTLGLQKEDQLLIILSPISKFRLTQTDQTCVETRKEGKVVIPVSPSVRQGSSPHD